MNYLSPLQKHNSIRNTKRSNANFISQPCTNLITIGIFTCLVEGMALSSLVHGQQILSIIVAMNIIPALQWLLCVIVAQQSSLVQRLHTLFLSCIPIAYYANEWLLTKATISQQKKTIPYNLRKDNFCKKNKRKIKPP